MPGTFPPHDPRQVSSSPTLPKPDAAPRRVFDVRELYQGPASTAEPSPAEAPALDEKLRQAYFWIVNHAIITPYYDIEFNEAPPTSFRFGGVGTEVRLPTAQSYSSFVLLPLLNFALRKRCLFIGGPGRGKTASAILMGILAGYSLKDVRRGIQHGQPQMTIADLLGNPLPKDLITASSIEDIKIAWRKWLSMRVKIINEYNRIPARRDEPRARRAAAAHGQARRQPLPGPAHQRPLAAPGRG